MRGRSPTSTANLSRESSIASSDQSTPYHNRIDINMDCNSTMGEPTPELSYEIEQEKALQISMAVDQQETTRPMGGYNKALPTHAPHKKSIINIQIPHNI